jgi:hypothetical protein
MTKQVATEKATSIIGGISMEMNYLKVVLSKLKNAPIEAVKSIENLNVNDVTVKEKAKCSYFMYNRTHDTYKIVIGMKGVEQSEKEDTKGRILYHEIAHYIDKKNGRITESEKYAKKFKSSIRKETKAIIADYESRDLMALLYGDMRGKIIVSDMISATYKNKHRVPHKHSGAYWKRNKYHINIEAFAHFYSALFIPSLRQEINQYYPQSFKLFMKMLKEISK